MTRSQKTIITFLSLIACILASSLGYYGYQTYEDYATKPLGPSLPQFAAQTLPPLWTPTAGTPQGIVTYAPTISFPATKTPEPICGGVGVMNVLAIGADSRSDTYEYGLADVIRLVRVDFSNARVTVLEFPRDLWVEIPDIADNINGQDHEKLNQAYLYGNRGFGYTDDPAQGPGLLARTLTLNFGTHIDHYAAVNMKTFVKLVNAVDGIDVTLPTAVDGRTAEDTNKRLLFLAGTHHLDGTRALTLARIRIEGTFVRADNQNRVLCALRDKLVKPDVIAKIPKLIQSFQGAIQTDLSPAQLGQLACIGTQIPSGNIVFASFPSEHFK